MRSFKEFKDVHRGKVLLVVGNGKNLDLTPPEVFGYLAIGMNTIVKHPNWVPDYYVAADRRVFREHGEEIQKKLLYVPKFLPAPTMTRWDGPNTFFFRTYPGMLWPKNRKDLWQKDLETGPLIYGNSMHIAIKLAYFMGAKTILIIGMEHKPHKADVHFWGKDEKMSPDQPVKEWIRGYGILAENLANSKVKLLNISQGTHVPAKTIPRDDWENWKEK